VLRMPAIVIGDHRNGGVANLRFARELRFRRVGHAHHVKTKLAMHVGLGQRGKLRAFHADIRSAAMDLHAAMYAGVRQYRDTSSHVGCAKEHAHQAFAKKSRNPVPGAVHELVGTRNSPGANLQAANPPR